MEVNTKEQDRKLTFTISLGPPDNAEFRTFDEVKAKGCFKGEIQEGKDGWGLGGHIVAHVVACINITQVKIPETGEHKYFCSYDFPEDCSENLFKDIGKYHEWF